jgi:hypothetical protein
MQRVTMLALILWVLLACGGEPAPTGEELVATQVAVERAAAATLAAEALVDATEPPAPTNTAEPTEPPPPTKTPPPTETAAPTVTPEPTPAPLGLSRSNPAPGSEVFSAPNLDIQVLQVKRGKAAWNAVKKANRFNAAPPKGMEYVAVKLHVTSTHSDDESHFLGPGDFKITGHRSVLYSSASIVDPKPALDAELFSGGEATGWATFTVRKGEENLILIVDELWNWDEDRIRFIAIDEGAAVGILPDLDDIEPTELGVKRAAPVPLGEVAASQDWEVQILEVLRGKAAWKAVKKANPLNDPPDKGMVYLAARVRARYIGTADEPSDVGSAAFQTTGIENVMYEAPPVVDPAPALDCTLYPGGVCEGWVVLQAAKGETGLTAVFQPLWDLSGENERFLALE